MLLTDQPGDDVAAIERRHRARARVEDRICCAKDTGLRNLPFRQFAHDAVWVELVLIAQDLIAWAQMLLLDGELARAEPKRLRYLAPAHGRPDHPLGAADRPSPAEVLAVGRRPRGRLCATARASCPSRVAPRRSREVDRGTDLAGPCLQIGSEGHQGPSPYPSRSFIVMLNITPRPLGSLRHSPESSVHRSGVRTPSR